MNPAARSSRHGYTIKLRLAAFRRDEVNRPPDAQAFQNGRMNVCLLAQRRESFINHEGFDEMRAACLRSDARAGRLALPKPWPTASEENGNANAAGNRKCGAIHIQTSWDIPL